MWTPKRVLLLAGGIAIFLAGYIVYAFFLGGIDGMPPLPEPFLRAESVIPLDNLPMAETEIDQKLRMAFGKDCPELKKHFRFEIRKKGMVVSAADMSFKEADGRVKLTDFSIALFKDNPEDRALGKFPDINTIKSDKAFLTFATDDGKQVMIESATDMSKGKISGAELQGNIVIINNRQSEEKHDDLEVLVSNEPLFYAESSAKVWSDGFVKLLDKKTKPHPTVISGHGMEMHFVKDQPADKKHQAARGPRVKNELSGVDRIELKSTVEMDLYSDAKSDFMSGSAKGTPKNPKLEAAQAPAFEISQGLPQLSDLDFTKAVVKPSGPADEKELQDVAHIKITTEGPFVYDMTKEVARFDSPPAKQESSFPDRVHVQRWLLRDEEEHKLDMKCDQLLCDMLSLKFRRGAESAIDSKQDNTTTDRQIETAQATARPGSDVVLVLDSNNLHCFCQQLDYQCPTGDRGARTVLRGDPLNAAQEGHKITTKELTLVSANNKGMGQQMVAQGPGQVDLYDKTPDPAKGPNATKGYTTHATWKGLLTQSKYKEGNRDLDLLTLTEDATFVDDERLQKMSGQILKVWLEGGESPSQATLATTNADAGGGGPRQKPMKIEGYERVKAESPDSRISARDRLIIRFKDGVVAKGVLPGESSMPAPSEPGLSAPKQPGGNGAQGSFGPQAPAAPSGSPMNLGLNFAARDSVSKDKDKDKAKEKPKPPINLSANDVGVDVLRSAEKNDLQELTANGNVHVHQEGEKPGDKGVDIKGETLNLLHFVEGDIIKVFGDATHKAEMQMDDQYLTGPKITINQKDNTAAVEGTGAMTMPSNTTFNGDKPTKPGTRLTVHWERDMLFDGRESTFRGGVVAYQDDSTLQCQLLVVTLDHKVSLKEGDKGDQKAKVDKVLGYDGVCVLDNTKDDKGRPQTQCLQAHSLDIDNSENELRAPGPGLVAALQYQTPGELDAAKAPKQAKGGNKQPELMLTRVQFQQRLYSKQLSDSTRQSNFTGNIVVIYVPANKLDAQVEMHKLPKDGLWLQCERLTVLERKLADGSKSQTMQAEQRVFCKTNDMQARAEVVIFDKTQDIMTFKGSPGNPARLDRIVGGPGTLPQTTTGQVIQYNRKTNTALADGVGGISGQLPPEEQFRPAEEAIVARR